MPLFGTVLVLNFFLWVSVGRPYMSTSTYVPIFLSDNIWPDITWKVCKQKQNNNTLYHKFPKYSDTQNICCNHSKILTMWLYRRVMSPNDADGMANSVDPNQTAPLGAV